MKETGPCASSSVSISGFLGTVRDSPRLDE